LALLFTVILLRCTYQADNPIEGTWDMQYSEWSTAYTTFVFNKSDSARQIKVFEKKHYVWLQQDLKDNPANRDFMIGGAGSYSISGDTLFEVLIISPWQDAQGKSLTSKIEINGDTLIHLFPFPGNEPEIWKEWTGKEIYIRME
jgi:hypothetical protein